MNITDKLKTFTASDKDRALGDIAICDGTAYATDGRIAFAVKLDEPHADEVPGGYPIGALKGVLAEPTVCSTWSRIDPEAFKALDENFKSLMRQKMIEGNNDYNDRYNEMTCPCCGGALYYDTWDDKLVEEREKKPDFDARDVEHSLRIVFDNGEAVNINFCYLHMIWSAFGPDLLFAAGQMKESKNRALIARSKDGKIRGMVMWIAVLAGDTTKCMLAAKSVNA